MEILHLVRSVPDAATEIMMEALSHQKRSVVIKLYEKNLDWDGILDAIFDSKRIVSWW